MDTKGRYLVIDDSPTVRKHLAYLLKLVSSEEAQVLEAENMVKALAVFRVMRPGVVFLDMMMPRQKDGMDTMKAILKEQPDAKIILCTALDQSHPAVQTAISAGATAYIRKPLTVKALQIILEELEMQSGRFRRVI